MKILLSLLIVITTSVFFYGCHNTISNPEMSIKAPNDPEFAERLNDLLTALGNSDNEIRKDNLTETAERQKIRQLLITALYNDNSKSRLQAKILLYKFVAQDLNVNHYFRGKILTVANSLLILTINIGSNDGVNLNDRFVILRNGELAGEVRVYKIIDQCHSACEIELTIMPLEAGDLIYTPFLEDYINMDN